MKLFKSKLYFYKCLLFVFSLSLSFSTWKEEPSFFWFFIIKLKNSINCLIFKNKKYFLFSISLSTLCCCCFVIFCMYFMKFAEFEKIKNIWTFFSLVSFFHQFKKLEHFLYRSNTNSDWRRLRGYIFRCFFTPVTIGENVWRFNWNHQNRLVRFWNRLENKIE